MKHLIRLTPLSTLQNHNKLAPPQRDDVPNLRLSCQTVQEKPSLNRQRIQLRRFRGWVKLQPPHKACAVPYLPVPHLEAPAAAVPRIDRALQDPVKPPGILVEAQPLKPTVRTTMRQHPRQVLGPRAWPVLLQNQPACGVNLNQRWRILVAHPQHPTARIVRHRFGI